MRGVIIIQRATEIISREIERLVEDMDKYREQIDNCIPFSGEYWKYHDKHSQCLIEINCLTAIKNLLKEG